MDTNNSPHDCTAETDGDSVDICCIFRALSHRRRRYILDYLCDHAQVAIDDLAIQLAAWELDCSRPAVPDERVTKLTLSLAHVHLPQLDDEGLVEYNHQSGLVRSTPPPALLEDALASVAAMADSQSYREIDASN